MLPIPLNARYETMEWNSSDYENVDVDQRGIISVIGNDPTDITCKISDKKGNSFSAVSHINSDHITDIQEELLIEDEIKIWGINKYINILNLKSGQNIMIFDIKGQLINQATTYSSEIKIPVISNGIYIVKIDNSYYKIVCK